MKQTARVLVGLVVSAAVVATVGSQEPMPRKPAVVKEPERPKFVTNGGNLHFETKIGSFKSINAAGKLEMTFQGTVLLSEYAGAPPKFVGNIHKEFEGHNKVVYFGRGKMTIDGNWRGVQWFGKDLKASFSGQSLFRLVGEFDKDLNTGTYYYDDPKKIHYWPTAVSPVFVPEPKMPGTEEPMERPKPGSGNSK